MPTLQSVHSIHSLSHHCLPDLHCRISLTSSAHTDRYPTSLLYLLPPLRASDHHPHKETNDSSFPLQQHFRFPPASPHPPLSGPCSILQTSYQTSLLTPLLQWLCFCLRHNFQYETIYITQLYTFKTTMWHVTTVPSLASSFLPLPPTCHTSITPIHIHRTPRVPTTPKYDISVTAAT